jgi:hypothetical protein
LIHAASDDVSSFTGSNAEFAFERRCQVQVRTQGRWNLMLPGNFGHCRVQFHGCIDSILCKFRGEDGEAGIANEFDDLSPAPGDRLFARDIVVVDKRSHFLVAVGLE